MHRIIILFSKKTALDLLLKVRFESKLTIRHASVLTHTHTHISVQFTSLTMILSSQVLSSPKCCRMDLTCSKANLSLEQRQMGNKLSQKFNAGFKFYKVCKLFVSTLFSDYSHRSNQTIFFIIVTSLFVRGTLFQRCLLS